MTRLLCLKTADMMDPAGNKAAHDGIAMIKIQVPNIVFRIIDDAIQAHGDAGVSDDVALASNWTTVRTIRLANGSDKVRARALARHKFRRHDEAPS